MGVYKVREKIPFLKHKQNPKFNNIFTPENHMVIRKQDNGFFITKIKRTLSGNFTNNR